MLDKLTGQEQQKEPKILQIQVRIPQFNLNNLDQVQLKDFKVPPSNN